MELVDETVHTNDVIGSKSKDEQFIEEPMPSVDVLNEPIGPVTGSGEQFTNRDAYESTVTCSKCGAGGILESDKGQHVCANTIKPYDKCATTECEAPSQVERAGVATYKEI